MSKGYINACSLRPMSNLWSRSLHKVRLPEGRIFATLLPLVERARRTPEGNK
jgi:hypothetical protein